MKLRQMATAFLFRQDSVLLMRRPGTDLIPAGFWTAIGGHLEPFELNDPYAACLREIHEETGIEPEEIEELSLRYILLRQKDDEIRQQFVYFGKTRREDVVTSDEGELHWIPSSDLPHLDMSKIIHLMWQHDRQRSQHEGVTIGTMTVSTEGTPQVQWSSLVDPKVF